MRRLALTIALLSFASPLHAQDAPPAPSPNPNAVANAAQARVAQQIGDLVIANAACNVGLASAQQTITELTSKLRANENASPPK